MPSRQQTTPAIIRPGTAVGTSTCVFCGLAMSAPNDIDGTPIHPDCFTRMCVAALVEDAPARRWIPYLGWSE